MNKLAFHERRGLNRQHAIDYLGVKSSYLDKAIRPHLTAMRMGTAAFLRLHPEELRYRAKAGRVPAAKVGKRWVFRRVCLGWRWHFPWMCLFLKRTP